MKAIVKHSNASNLHRVLIQDSTSTAGAGLTGLTSASAGLIISTLTDNEAAATAYTVTGSTIESITTLGTYVAPTATKCRFKEVDATNHPGLYELQFADARYSVASAKKLIVTLSGATDMAERSFEVQLDVNIVKDVQDIVNHASYGNDQLVRATTPANTLDVDVDGDVTAENMRGTDSALTDKAGFSLAATGLDAIASTATGMVEIAKAIWDRVISKANHNTPGSAAKLLRELGVLVAVEGTTSGTPTTTSVTTNITGYDNNFFKDQTFMAYNGAAMTGQSRIISTYNGTTGVFTFAEPFTTALSSGDDVIVFSSHSHNITEIAEGVRADIDANSTQLAAIKAETDNLPSAIKKNTALANFEFFMRDSADNITGKTLLTVTAQRSIDGAAFANCANSVTEVSAGIYKIDLAATDLNGNVITLKFTATGARATIVTIITKP